MEGATSTGWASPPFVAAVELLKRFAPKIWGTLLSAGLKLKPAGKIGAGFVSSPAFSVEIVDGKRGFEGLSEFVVNEAAGLTSPANKPSFTLSEDPNLGAVSFLGELNVDASGDTELLVDEDDGTVAEVFDNEMFPEAGGLLDEEKGFVPEVLMLTPVPVVLFAPEKNTTVRT